MSDSLNRALHNPAPGRSRKPTAGIRLLPSLIKPSGHPRARTCRPFQRFYLNTARVMFLLLNTLLLVLVVLATIQVRAEDRIPLGQGGDGTLERLLGKSGHVLLIRHALAPGTGDPSGFRIDDCSTQRNLSAQGREQARDLGQRLRAQGISSARIFSSQWCRCLETAELLGLGPVVPLPALNSFFQEMRLAEERTKELSAFLRGLPDGPPVVMVTHQVNISALTGRFTQVGQGVVVRIDPEHVQVVRAWP